MKRALDDPSDGNAPPRKRHKKNPTPPLFDNANKPSLISTISSISDDLSSSSSSDDDLDNECCICFSKIDLPIKLDCGHQFCFLCLKEIRMQSQVGFTFNITNCDSDNDSDSADDDIDNNNNDTDTTTTNTTATATNTNNNNKRKKKKTEKFSCPYCRREFDVDVIDRATMNADDWINNVNTKKSKRKSKKDSEEIVIWQYSGRKGGWWAYQDGHKKQLEKGYRKFLKQLKIEQQKEQDALNKMKNKTVGNDNDNVSNKYGFSSDKDKDNNNDHEDGLPFTQIMIEIGIRKYICDFAQMRQFDNEFPDRKRKLRRRVETKHTLKKTDSLKGCAGKFFNKKDDNNNKNDQTDKK